jgi:DNA mismatch repair ATPase MutL
MPIAELPRSAISAIGATSALLDSSSVIKELLDNALDALATSIVIEISQNGLDVLQVKDNGSGIDPEDRKLACKPNCTSKINSLDDLRDAGPKFLGFRGLALASIAEMSGGVLVTTRVNEEPVGSRLKYDRTGELVGQVTDRLQQFSVCLL